MRQLKKVIKEAINDAGIKKALDQEGVVIRWSEFVGKKISSVSTAERASAGILVVRVDTSAWRQELHLQKEEIIKNINKKFGSKVIKEIRFI